MKTFLVTTLSFKGEVCIFPRWRFIWKRVILVDAHVASPATPLSHVSRAGIRWGRAGRPRTPMNDHTKPKSCFTVYVNNWLLFLRQSWKIGNLFKQLRLDQWARRSGTVCAPPTRSPAELRLDTTGENTCAGEPPVYWVSSSWVQWQPPPWTAEPTDCVEER